MLSKVKLLFFNLFTSLSITIHWLQREVRPSIQFQRSPLIGFWQAIRLEFRISSVSVLEQRWVYQNYLLTFRRFTRKSKSRLNASLTRDLNACPASNYMFKVNYRNSRARCETCSKLTIKTPEQRHWRRSSVFIVDFQHISHLVLVFLLLTLHR